MRMISLILALGAIFWVIYQMAGGGAAETAIPQGHQQALEKAQALEQSMQSTIEQRLQTLEEEEP